MGSIKKMDLNHLIGQKVGSSTLIKEIARGNMGAVFLGYQGSLKRQIAVKVLPKSIITERNAKTFQQEAELAAILSHPNIIPVYEVGDAGDFLFLAMQLVKGKTLSYYIQRQRKNILPSKRTLPLDTTFKVIISILNALDYAHHQSIIHRDVKPGNILVEEYDKRPIIVDFGLAKVIRRSDDTPAVIVGTPLYMAPEQILKPEVDGRADIYAAATMLFEMLIPTPLFPGIRSSKELIKMKIEKKDKLFDKMPSEINPNLDKEIDLILSKALTFKPENRYASCHELCKELEQYSNRYLKN